MNDEKAIGALGTRNHDVARSENSRHCRCRNALDRRVWKPLQRRVLPQRILHRTARDFHKKRGSHLRSLGCDFGLDGAVAHDAVQRRLRQDPRVADGRCTNRRHPRLAEQHAHFTERRPWLDHDARDPLAAHVHMRFASPEEVHRRAGGAFGNDVIARNENSRFKRSCERGEFMCGHAFTQPALLEQGVRLRVKVAERFLSRSDHIRGENL
mmetsp:Transcript_5106/g.16189  ORF Transcript_5106/g.16189 Transcript_5106/m.16189 type:complete len:211 (-) Transcript_5106:727-1359(-)